MTRRRTVVVIVLAALAIGIGAGESFSLGGSESAQATIAPQLAVAGPAPSPGGSLQAQYVAVVKRVAPSVVQIETSQGLGSGVVFDTKGNIVTNYHVVGSAEQVSVTIASGKKYTGKVVGTYAREDLAVVRVNGPRLRPVPFANSARLQVGYIVLAIGNPLGFRSSVTEGIISGLGRTISEGNSTGAAISNAIQTSASINPGNSGGALVDLSGRLVGVPTINATDPQLGGQALGIGFAIPSNTVKSIATQIVQHGKVVNSNRAFLGVSVGDTFGANGVYVGTLTPDGPAAKAGIRTGDIIRGVAGKPTTTTDALSTVLAGLKPKQRVPVKVKRADGTSKTFEVTLGEAPGS